jgi:ribosome-associated translation inhibitor RaiA
MERSMIQTNPEVQVVIHGEVPPDCVEHARKVIRKATLRTVEPVLHARVRLSQGRDPAVPRSAIAQANLSVNGRPVRAHVAAETMHEAIDLLEDRLVHRLNRLREAGHARHAGAQGAEPPDSRQVSERKHHPEAHHRSGHEPRVVRRKSFSLARETPGEAVFEMELMDYGFHLFTDAESGTDSVVYRAGPTGYRVARVRPSEEPAGAPAAPLTASRIPAVRLSLTEAEQRLELLGLPFVFFADRESRRGNVLYRRYDGCYGLITPAE